MTDLIKIVDQLSTLTIMEAAELAKMLEEKWGVSAAAPVAVMPASAIVEPVPEKTEFDIVLMNIGDKKIEVIKITRELTGLGLKEAKELVEAAPKTLKHGMKKEEAENFKAKFDVAGAKVEIK